MSTIERVRALPGRRWVEVAVVAGCLLLLAGVLLPAFYNARQAARMTQSKNNLRQHGLAMQNYHNVSSVFPLGGDLEGVLLTFPHVKVMTIPTLNDDNVQIVARFRDLEILQARRIELTEQGFLILKSQPKLQSILER